MPDRTSCAPALVRRVAYAVLFQWELYAMNRFDTRGFTLIELAITVLVLGLLFTFSIPAYHSISASYQLHGATENIAAQLRMAREKAISTGADQPMHFTANYLGTSDYHIHYASGMGAMWRLPNGISYYAVTVTPTMHPDGHSSGSGIVVLQDTRGKKDTVSVMTSGLVLVR
jgi:prepilin-type N-terminal cleavage/methylation domain-containing protein